MDIREYLRQNKVAFEAHEHVPAYTAQMVAAEEHVTGYLVAKVVVVEADGKFVMCVLPAPHKLDLRKVGGLVGARDVRLADEKEIAGLFPDVEVGAEPPFGKLYNLPTLVDGGLAERGEVVFQGGTHRQAIRMKYADYARLAQPVTGDLVMAKS
jgi:Ala-tRNA(Pro) deacylase